MKVLIVNNMAPFVWGGAEELAAHLQKNLIVAGHDAEILRIPFQWEPPAKIPSQMLMVRAFELSNVDHVIALKFPAYLIRHPRKTLWLVHQYRQAYDLLDQGLSNLPSNEFGNALQRVVQTADDESFLESRKIFSISEVTRQRLLQYNGADSIVLPPPINNKELFSPGTSGGYIFAGGRVNAMKRQHLLLEAMINSDKNVRLLIAGPPDTPADADRLTKLVSDNNLTDRVKLDLRFLPRKTYADYVNNSTAVACIPFNEDYGYVAIEAAAAAKPIIATSDSGGILSFAKHEVTGWVVDPNVDALASAMNTVFKNTERTREYGFAALQLMESQMNEWPQIVDRLVS
ncbi:glycosyltransferase family protein [Hydrogenophaga taeniospiralis CCUG 15921]|uniref:Glycosyltransferase family protein n=1 Tax=Hydrogenophaga taeniospiralis CCUG 15921 TaxID=1281780 RepID=A0A9X4NVT7_9BURK|nr:glycosyltransferase family 4 protein [Hydrogenophaga taeniospiralis]MDG5977184.1 glycosyltransferase family protein [Hydrogenophaga taeniospiralis CCUG 15921]